MLNVSGIALVLVFLQHSLDIGSCVKIDVTTQYHDGVIPNAFNIRCAPEQVGNCEKTIISIQLTKDGDKNIAAIQGSSISYARLLRSSVEAEGFIDSDLSKTYLSVTIKEAVREDSGLYSCQVLYFDDSLNVQVETASHNVTITSQDTQDLIKHMMSKISLLENLVQFQQDELTQVKTRLVEQGAQLDKQATCVDKPDSSMGGAISVLQDTMSETSQKLDQLISRENRSVSFVALHNRKGPITTGRDLIFSDVISNEGGGYNHRTGVFTAPVTGDYMFHLSVTAHGDKRIYVDIKNNKGQILTRLGAFDRYWVDYSDTSCITRLNTGDYVKPVIRLASAGASFSYLNTKDYMNKFYGYLLKAV